MVALFYCISNLTYLNELGDSRVFYVFYMESMRLGDEILQLFLDSVVVIAET